MAEQILSLVLPVLVMIALGRLCCARGVLNDERHRGLKDLIGNVLLPVVLFNAFFTADYSARMLLVFAAVFLSCGAALAAGYALRRFAVPYGRFMPLLMTGFEGGMLGYALFGLLYGQGSLSTFAMADVGQTTFAYTVFLAALRSAAGERTDAKSIMRGMLTNRAFLGMLLGILLGALGVGRRLLPTAAGTVLSAIISFVSAPTSALILLVVGYQLNLSRALLRPVLTTIGLRLAVMAALCAVTSWIIFTLTPFDHRLMTALLLLFSLPAPFIIPLFADVGDQGEYISTTLSLSTLVTVALYALIAAYAMA